MKEEIIKNIKRIEISLSLRGHWQENYKKELKSVLKSYKRLLSEL